MCICKCGCHISNFDKARKDYHKACGKPTKDSTQCRYCIDMCRSLHIT